MKTIGLIGGISWFSTAVYYKTINELESQQLGLSHSAKLLLYSVDFQEFKTLQENEDWEGIEEMISAIAGKPGQAGADFVVLASNTPHIVADKISERINLPLLHIAEETAKQVAKKGLKQVALLGTKFTMGLAFFRDRLAKYSIDVIVPDFAAREYIHNAIINELTRSIFRTESRSIFLMTIERLKQAGAEAVIFGCTEISLLMDKGESSLPVFDTTLIHSNAAVDFALA